MQAEQMQHHPRSKSTRWVSCNCKRCFKRFFIWLRSQLNPHLLETKQNKTWSSFRAGRNKNRACAAAVMQWSIFSKVVFSLDAVFQPTCVYNTVATTWHGHADTQNSDTTQHGTDWHAKTRNIWSVTRKTSGTNFLKIFCSYVPTTSSSRHVNLFHEIQKCIANP